MATQHPLRILSIAHSYVAGVNRRLAHEIARAGGEQIEITAVAPRYFHGGRDLRPVRFSAQPHEPCAVRAIPARFTKSPHAFFYSRRLREMMMARRFDLVHSWEEPFVVAGAQIAFHTPRNVPLVFWTAQNIDKRYPPPFAQFEQYCLNRCAGWMACGQRSAETLLARGYDRKPHRVMPLGVDTQMFRPDEAARRATRRSIGFDEKGPPVVGFLGRFTQEKGLAMLMHALDHLHIPWRALLVGAGPMMPAVRRWAATHGARVRVCDEVAHDDAWRYLNAMDVLCAPSQTTPTWREQFGRMLIEGFACGVPVIGSDSGEIPFVIGDAGMICSESDRTAWTRALRNLFADSARRNELRQRGIQRANDHFAWPIIGRAHVEFFKSIVDGA